MAAPRTPEPGLRGRAEARSLQPNVVRSARAQAHLLWRYRKARLAVVVAVAVPLLATVPQQLQATYPTPDAVTNAWDWYLHLGLAGLPVIIATTVAGQRERGLCRQRVLDGEPELDQTAATAVVFTVATALAGVAVVVGETLIAGINNAIAAPSGYSSRWDVTGLLTASLLTVLMAVSVGTLVGAVSHRAVTAAILALALGIGGYVLVPVADLVPSLQYAVAALPQGVLTLVGRQDLGKIGAGEVDVAAIAAFAWPTGAVVLAAWSTRRASRVHVNRALRRRPRAVGAAVLVPGAALVLAAGYLVPVALRDQIPWQYRPSWLADKAAHRTSVDIAKRFVADVRHGRLAAANRLTISGNAVRVLGPYRELVLGAGVQVLGLKDNDRLEPGSVPVTTEGGQLTLCLTRRDERWIIIDLRTFRPCPPATSR